jgi:ferrous iron transport protein B
MGRVGLSGRAFIPLLSSFACAIPGIMATRTIDDRRDRITTIMIAPFMSCSARLPVYALLIGAFVPRQRIAFLTLPGITLFSMYFLGILAAVAVAAVLKRTALRGGKPLYVMELPPYRMPSWRSVLVTVRERSVLFPVQGGHGDPSRVGGPVVPRDVSGRGTAGKTAQRRIVAAPDPRRPSSGAAQERVSRA